jgi:hypothetical protein
MSPWPRASRFFVDVFEADLGDVKFDEARFGE